MVLRARPCRVQADLGSGTGSVNMIYLTQNTNTVFVYLLCSLTLSESAPSSLLPDFQPVLPVRPLSLQIGAPAAASFPQIATLRHFPLPALPSGRRALHTHRSCGIQFADVMMCGRLLNVLFLNLFSGVNVISY